ncbi:MAG: hypothetical protein QOG19_370 [Mycobacterium sp.]|nr:hypothetical protein [Mycobacterium sp.]
MAPARALDSVGALLNSRDTWLAALLHLLIHLSATQSQLCGTCESTSFVTVPARAGALSDTTQRQCIRYPPVGPRRRPDPASWPAASTSPAGAPSSQLRHGPVPRRSQVADRMAPFRQSADRRQGLRCGPGEQPISVVDHEAQLMIGLAQGDPQGPSLEWLDAWVAKHRRKVAARRPSNCFNTCWKPIGELSRRAGCLPEGCRFARQLRGKSTARKLKG